jgi:peptide/nickel transport system substrate-binding protein
MNGLVAAMLGVTIALAACSGPPARPGSDTPTGAAAATQRTLVITNRAEPPSIAAKRLETSSVTWGTTLRLFSAYLALIDNRGAALPYLAAKLPELETDTWRVFPDGRMETTYRLRPDLAWHDGAPLTAEDFVFSWRLYSTPEFGYSTAPPESLIEEAVALDPHTLVVRWRASYPDAARITDDYPPLPRHILAEPYAQAAEARQFDAFVNHPYWNVEYVGAGPFKLERWEPGAFLEATAFEKHALGQAKIDRVRLHFTSDANAVLASLLAGELHAAVDDSVRFQQGLVLRREWQQNGAGKLTINPTQWRYTYVQMRPDLAQPRSLLDLRVRRALAHTLDRQGLNEGLFEGEGMVTETLIPPTVSYFPALDRAVMKYPHDPRRSEELMGQAGYTRGPDGIFVSPAAGRFESEYKVLASPHNNTEGSILAAGWRQSGFDVKEAAFTAAQGSDAHARATFTGMHTTSGSPLGEGRLGVLHSSQIPTAENRWRGGNRSSWANSEYDRLFDVYSSTLDRARRDQLVIDMMRVYAEELPAFSLYFGLAVLPHSSALVGPGQTPPETDVSWNVYEWTWR